MHRFWVMGPVETQDGDEVWGVVDGLDTPSARRAPKPSGYQEFWNAEWLARAHAEYMSLLSEALENTQC